MTKFTCSVRETQPLSGVSKAAVSEPFTTGNKGKQITQSKTIKNN